MYISNIHRTTVLTISGFNVSKCLAMSTFDLIFSTSWARLLSFTSWFIFFIFLDTSWLCGLYCEAIWKEAKAYKYAHKHTYQDQKPKKLAGYPASNRRFKSSEKKTVISYTKYIHHHIVSWPPICIPSGNVPGCLFKQNRWKMFFSGFKHC
jgi:hypothetical protein